MYNSLLFLYVDVFIYVFYVFRVYLYVDVVFTLFGGDVFSRKFQQICVSGSVLLAKTRLSGLISLLLPHMHQLNLMLLFLFG